MNKSLPGDTVGTVMPTHVISPFLITRPMYYKELELTLPCSPLDRLP